MKRIVLIIFSFFICWVALPQVQWRFKSDIEKCDYKLLKGFIADKRPITMYLEETGSFCSNENKWTFSYGIRGWYYYDDNQKKKPLLGSYEGKGEDGCCINLFVPENILDTINNNSCKVEKYKEVFSTCESDSPFSCSFVSMKWKQNGQEEWFDVNLKLVGSAENTSKAQIVLEVNGWDFYSFDLSGATAIDNIESVNLLSSKAVDSNFYLIFSFAHLSNPGANGHGYCGGGYEEYLGFLHLNDSFDIMAFDYYLTESCNKMIESSYTYDLAFPENGIRKYEYIDTVN